MGLPVKRPKNNLVVIDPKEVRALKPSPTVPDDIEKMVGNWWNKKRIKSDSSLLEAKIRNGELHLRTADLILSKKEKEWTYSIFKESKAMELEKMREAYKTFVILEEEKRLTAEMNMINLRHQNEFIEIETERKIAEQKMLIAKTIARTKEFEDE